MATTATARVGLVKPDDDEDQDVSVLDGNLDAIDARLGTILVNAGVTPPNASLYDGALVKEKTSGIVWCAEKNVGGTFDTRYVTYPWHAVCAIASQSFVNNTATVKPLTYERGKNSLPGSVDGSGNLVLPVKGVYITEAFVNYGASATGTRKIEEMINGAGSGDIDERAPSTANAYGVYFRGAVEQYAAGTTYNLKFIQSSGGGLNISFRLRVALLFPVV